ncbi:hypothetical protein V6259_18690 [Marinomonas sp. TI.3.20]
MEKLVQLLLELETISLNDISKIPNDYQHILAAKIEDLQDQLKMVLK